MDQITDDNLSNIYMATNMADEQSMQSQENLAEEEPIAGQSDVNESDRDVPQQLEQPRNDEGNDISEGDESQENVPETTDGDQADRQESSSVNENKDEGEAVDVTLIQPTADEHTENTTEEKEQLAAEEAEGGEAFADQVVEGGLTTVAEGDEEDETDLATAEDEEPKTSETFADGEKPESPLIVGERLSQNGSPNLDEKLEQIESPPVPGTPQEDEEEEEEYVGEEEEEEEEYEEAKFDREELIERYHQALAEREQIQQQNHQLQHRLAEYFRKKKSDDTRQDMDKNVTDQEQRYLKYMANLDELRRQDMEERESYKVAIEEYKERCEEKQERVDEERDKFVEFKKLIALNAINSRSGKPISPKDVEIYLGTEMRKEGEVVNVRLENIKLKNKLRKKEQQLKSKEELAEGLHLIDFEQLKIENQTYNEKIEERNEELLKLRRKITSTVQVLTHLKEKLQFVQAENQVLKGKLRDVEEDAAKKRDKLTRTKQARDHLRIDNHRLRQNCGLLGNEPLLRDFENRKDESSELRDQLERLKMEHAELTLTCNGVRKKIEQARAGRS